MIKNFREKHRERLCVLVLGGVRCPDGRTPREEEDQS